MYCISYIHVNSTCSRCCCSLPSFFEGCAPDLSQELGDGNEAEFQQYDCPMIQDFFLFFLESARGWGRCFVDWMVVFSKKCSVMMVGCCRKKMLLQVFSYEALLCFFVRSHACQQMMPSPLCFQTLSWRFSVSRLVAIWGFTFLGHVFCGIFQLKGVFLSLEKLTLKSSINRRRWPKMVMLEKVMLWVGIHDIASCEVMQPDGAPSGILLFLFIKMLGMKALLWSKAWCKLLDIPTRMNREFCWIFKLFSLLW